MFTSITHSISPQNCSHHAPTPPRPPFATHTTLKSHLPLFSNTPSISVFFHPFLFKLFHPLPDSFANLESSSNSTKTRHCVSTLIKNRLQPLPPPILFPVSFFHRVTNVLPHSFILNACSNTSCFRCLTAAMPKISHCST